MKKLLAAAVAVAVLAGAALWLWPERSTATRRVATAPFATLRVEDRSRTEITPGTPLVFTLSLASAPSSAPFTVGNRWRGWTEMVRLESVGPDARVFTQAHAGVPESLQLSRGAQPAVDVASTGIAQFNADRRLHRVRFDVAPDATTSAKPGAYHVRAILETPFWVVWGWRGRVASTTATIVVLDPAQQDERTRTAERDRHARLAEYHLVRERFNDARKAAETLAAAEPRSVRAYILLGDALAGLKQIEEARRAYHYALAVLPRSYEQPDLLLERIEQLKQP